MTLKSGFEIVPGLYKFTYFANDKFVKSEIIKINNGDEASISNIIRILENNVAVYKLDENKRVEKMVHPIVYEVDYEDER